MKILIVDDEEIARKSLRDILEELEHEIVGEAVNGQDGFEKYKELKPEIVFMDLMMPECDGNESIKLIKDFDPNAKIILATIVGEAKEIIKALNLGAKAYCRKPAQIDKVMTCIEKASR